MKLSKRFEVVERHDIVERSEKFLWTDGGEPGLRYLLGRGLTKGTIKKFRLGYIPNGANHQLHGRVIMPLYDASNNLIAVTSRLTRQPKTDDFLPVYWHESYEKSFYLYGLNIAKTVMREWGFGIIVEGQFDTM